MSKKVVRILSIDGGGIRGLIPAIILDAIETRTAQIEIQAAENENRDPDVQEGTDGAFIPTSELFDLIAGTSTGGILALGLTMPNDVMVPPAERQPAYTAQALAALYREEGNQIFSRSIWHRIRSFGGMADERYPSDGIEEVLEERFQGTRLEHALTDVLIPSYDLENQWPRFFKSVWAQGNPLENFLMRDVARATSAAPTYFEPHRFEGQEPAEASINGHLVVDGGIFANHPAMCAFAEARMMHQDAEILLVSLGTGELTRTEEFEDAEDWGALSWVRPLFRIIFDGASDTVDYQLQQLLPGIEAEREYYRFQPRLDRGNDDMDDASETNLFVLESVVNEFIEERTDELDALCQRLHREWLEREAP